MMMQHINYQLSIREYQRAIANVCETAERKPFSKPTLQLF